MSQPHHFGREKIPNQTSPIATYTFQQQSIIYPSQYIPSPLCINVISHVLLSIILRVFFLTPKDKFPLRYKGGWLFTSPEEPNAERRCCFRDRCVPADCDSTDGGMADGASIQRVRQEKFQQCDDGFASQEEVKVKLVGGEGRGGHYGSLEVEGGGGVNRRSGSGSGESSLTVLYATAPLPHSHSLSHCRWWSRQQGEEVRWDSSELQQQWHLFQTTEGRGRAGQQIRHRMTYYTNFLVTCMT